jgi:anaerobic selenocysteine-containing dehydrogenase
MVHASAGRLKPASEHLLSEVAIVAGIARAALPDSPVDWEAMTADYDLIRDRIEAVYPDFADFNARIRIPGGFRLPNGASERKWHTPGGKANFLALPGMLEEDDGLDEDTLVCATLRSHDQYNTTIYGYDDRYRGVKGRRDVVFANASDLAARGLKSGDLVDIVAGGRRLPGQMVVEHAISKGTIAIYYPESNVLMSADAYDPESGVPAYKSIPVRLEPAA